VTAIVRCELTNYLVMAHTILLQVVLSTFTISQSSGLTTCPGFPGYCSESFPGQSCNVVCEFGRNNVPLCQEDGTWTDIPRCIEHDPGVEEQIPGTCPSIPGYCAQGFLNTRCQFDCTTGADIDSICTQDGTWAPYPTCFGDLRETRDGCDGCPGPQGGSRNRTAEAIINSNTISDRRVPKVINGNGGRKNIPSFAGNINIGRLNPQERPATQGRFNQRRPGQGATSSRRQPNRSGQSFQTNFNQRNPQRQFPQQTRQQQQPRQQQPPRQQQQPKQQQQPREQQSFNQGLNTFSANRESSQPLRTTRPPAVRPGSQTTLSPSQQKLRDRFLKQKEQRDRQIASILAEDTRKTTTRKPLVDLPPPSSANSDPNFGVFEEVDLAGRFRGPKPPPPPPRQAPRQPPSPQQDDGFFGVFPEVNLSG